MSTSFHIPLARTVLQESRVPTGAASGVRSPRRAFVIAIGLVWLVDAALQYQPYMFSANFVRQIIDPTFLGNPSWIASSEKWAAGVMIGHIVVYNAIFATIQLVIATAILWPRTTKAGLSASIAWALGVWWFGEGLGGIFTGGSPLAGVPGGVILYAFIALLIWPTNSDRSAPSSARYPVRSGGMPVATSGLCGRQMARVAWLTLWGSFAYFLVIPANRAPGSLNRAFTSVAVGEPNWLASFDHAAAGVLAGVGTPVNVGLATCCGFVAVSVFVPAFRRPGIVLAVVLAAFIWAAENFGGIFTGSGTDPNTGLLLVMLALLFWPSTQGSEEGLSYRGTADVNTGTYSRLGGATVSFGSHTDLDTAPGTYVDSSRPT